MAENTYLDDAKAAAVPQEVIDKTIEKVNKILNDNFPGFVAFGDGSFTISRGSSQVMIVVRPFIKNETCVECIANVVMGANITPHLMKYLLKKNAELHFGAFGLIFDDTITFSHSITGTNLDENELTVTLNSVAFLADYYDNIIVEMAGGKKALDYVEDYE
jgi:hypothetical protein